MKILIMKRFILLLPVPLVGIVLLVVHACSSSSPEIIKVDPGFKEYISGYSSGMMSREGEVLIVLEDQIPAGKKISNKQLQKLLTISPEVKGKVVLDENRMIQFIPDAPLPSGQFFTVSLQLDAFTKVKPGFEEFQFQFSTFEQVMNLSLDGLKSYNKFDARFLKLEGEIECRDFAETDKVKKTLEVNLNGKLLAVRLEEKTGENLWKFTIDSLERKSTEQSVEISWNGKPIRSSDLGKRTVKIPALGDFDVHSVNVIDEEDQSLEIRFGDPIFPGQDLKGMIRLLDTNGREIPRLSFDVDYNLVRVYLPNRFVGLYTLKCAAGIQSTAGGKMKANYERKIELNEPKPQVRLIGSGLILPNSQGLIFPFEAVSLKAVDVRIIKIYEKNVHHFLQVNDLDGDNELTRFGKIIAEHKVRLDYDKSKNLNQWNSHVLDLEKWITPEPGAIYQIGIKFDKTYITCACNEEKEKPLEPTNDEGWNESQWHSYGFDGYSDWGSWESYSPCEDGYYYGNAVNRNILASNIGMVFKLEVDKKSTVFLSDMLTTEPMANTAVEYYDFTNNLIAQGTTNSEGMFTTKLSRKPFLLIAKKGKQRGYLKLTDGLSNPLSKFDVGGEDVQEGIKGFIYAERGVWRPGDSIYVNFMLQDAKDLLPTYHPVNFEFRDPSGNIIYEVSRTTHENGIYDFRTATSESGKTGNYTAEVTVGNHTYTKLFKVETIKPNRLKIYLDAYDAYTKDSSSIRAEWLHGASAKGLEAEVELQLSPLKTTFKGYDDYAFDSPLRHGGTEQLLVFHNVLDRNGSAKFANKQLVSNEAAGMLRANYITKVYEKGGDFSLDRKMATYSPYQAYVGIKIPKGKDYYSSLETKKKYRFDIASVKPDGSVNPLKKVHLKVFKIDRKWWYENNEEITSYTFKEGAMLYRDTVLKCTSGKSSFEYSVPEYDYGTYLFLVTDEVGGHQSGTFVEFDWSDWSRSNRSDVSKASMLTFATDKKQYLKGEKVQISFPSPSKGRALISVETSQKIVKKFWIETQEGETVHEFETTAEMAPNAYVHITLLQPHHATKNDLPIRMYGIMPIEVIDPNTQLAPVITMGDEIRPESKARIQVHESNGRSMSYTLAIVDDGLLDLTHFQTPQPWNTFYSKEAIGVQTWDMYDYVLGAYTGNMGHLLSVGGDGEAIVGNGPKANRFPPMVKFVGSFTLPAGGSKVHEVEIPNYIGSVRVMVVARDDKAYGNAEKTVKVKKPLMVIATLPRVLGPGESFSMPVDVFAMEKHVKNVKVTVEPNEMFTLDDSKSKSIEFSQEGDEVIDFKMKVNNRIGIGKVKVTAVSGNETSTYEVELDIRASNPYTYDVQEFELEAGKSVDATVLFDGLLGSQSAVIEVSTMPQIQLEKRMKYLLEYPHGCVEQTTSSVFPQLYLNTIADLTDKQRTVIDRNIKAGIARLQLFQNYEGGFSYWPGDNGSNEWGTNYAGHFLLEAELLGYKLPAGMKARWVDYQKREASNWQVDFSRNGGTSDVLTQSYRLYLLALSGNADVGAMNRLKEKANLDGVEKYRLATAYAQLGLIEKAQDMVKGATASISFYRDLSGNFGSDVRDKAILLESELILNPKKPAHETAKEIAALLSSDRWMSTQETAYALLAFGKYATRGGNSAASKFAYSVDGKSFAIENIGKKLKQFEVLPTGAVKNSKLRLNNRGSGSLYVTVITRKIPKVGEETDKSSKLKMSVWYEDMDGKKIQPEKMAQGTEFKAFVKISNPTNKDYKEMALNQIFPSGWEIYNSRLFGSVGSRSGVQYDDIRDDRVLSYYSLSRNASITIEVSLHATYKGRFYLPAVYSEAMYDHGIHAQKKGKWIDVK